MGIFSPKPDPRIGEIQNRVDDHEKRIEDLENRLSPIESQLDQLGNYSEMTRRELERAIGALETLIDLTEELQRSVNSAEQQRVKVLLARLKNNLTRAENARKAR